VSRAEGILRRDLANASGVSRIGMIVPSSNTTMETELPELFRRQSERTGHQYTFHSARATLKKVTAEELAVMAGKAAECSVAVSDAHVDVIAYACLVAVMAQGPGAHAGAEELIARAAAGNGHPAPVTSSAGALVRALAELGARNVVMVTPYLPALTKMVRDYLEAADITVRDVVSLGVADNLEVGRLDQLKLPEIARSLERDGVDAVILRADAVPGRDPKSRRRVGPACHHGGDRDRLRDPQGPRASTRNFRCRAIARRNPAS